MVLFNPALGEPLLRVTGEGTPEQEMMRAKFDALSTPKATEPTIMFYGIEGRIFNEAAKEFARQAQANGSRYEFWMGQNARRGFFNGPPWHQVTARKADDTFSPRSDISKRRRQSRRISLRC